LTSTDIFVVLVMIDAHCVTLSATLSSKDALASRSYVQFAIIGQTLAWVAVLYTDIRLAGAGSVVDGHLVCVDVPWFDSMISPQRPEKSLPFRYYWISHAYDLIQPSVLAIYHTKRFDELEKIDREHRGAMGDQDENRTGYSRLPSTSFSVWRGVVMYPVLLIVVIERSLEEWDSSGGFPRMGSVLHDHHLHLWNFALGLCEPTTHGTSFYLHMAW
jgi:hypothetical protein